MLNLRLELLAFDVETRRILHVLYQGGYCTFEILGWTLILQKLGIELLAFDVGTRSILWCVFSVHRLVFLLFLCLTFFVLHDFYTLTPF